jgi:FHS family L-fucose permease-like MFS transporter
MSSEKFTNQMGQFISLVIVFFFGVCWSANDILIPYLKVYLSQVQSQLVAWAFYVAYFVGSIIFFYH